MIAGGEPLLRRGLLERAAKIPGPFMAVFTNGTLIDEEAMKLFEGSRMVPIFSIEGESASTAERRGAGVHEGCLEKMEELKRRGILYGASITLTSSNADEVLSKAYMKRLAGLGISALVLVEYVPVAGGTEGLVLSDKQKSKLLALEAAADLPFGIVALPGDEEAYGGCLAAGRGFIHLADDGRLEACPFAPFSDTEAGTMPLREALASPLMREIRARHSELKETKGGCALWNKRGWIAGFASCSALPPLRAMTEDRAAAS
jgi:MoaA/NifB/PqqE/SkfB family radical SAM enzyme